MRLGMEKKYWWKLLCIPILFYVIIVGIGMPLSPGIVKMSKETAKSGETFTTTVETYNTFFTKAKTVKARLRKDTSLFLKATEVNVLDDNHVQLTFDIPQQLPAEHLSNDFIQFSLDIDNDYDGYATIPSKVMLTQVPPSDGLPLTKWRNTDFGSLSQRGTTFPFRGILFETIRNTYFHVPLWFAMLFLFIGATWNSFKYLRTREPDHDLRAEVMTMVGLFFGVLGVVTGMLWAKSTWGTYWTWQEIKLNMTAIALLIYFAYFVLRNAFDDLEQRARVAAVYNLFAFVAALILINVIPRMTDSLHPGSGGNPAMGGEDMDGTMKMVFYPAIIGWTLLGFWIGSIYYRFRIVQEKFLEKDYY
ncbi:MAG: cytochrome c biogenesis protein CcsA [Bacteroidota bacterium]